MPTPKSAALFYRLVTARNRLNEVTQQLNSLETQASALKAEKRRLLELRWDEAFRAFESATKDFHESARRNAGEHSNAG